MVDEDRSRGALATVARLGGLGTLLVVVALAFAGMGLFMWNRGSDMSRMTVSVVQMGQDVTSMARNMETMATNMNQMARSMVEGQARMGDDFERVRIGMEAMTGNMAHLGNDINRFAQPQRMLPFSP